jgi:hypothetical protein
MNGYKKKLWVIILETPLFKTPIDVFGTEMTAAMSSIGTYTVKEYFLDKDIVRSVDWVLKSPYYIPTALEWEEDEIKRGKPTGKKLWCIGAIRNVSLNLLANFPTLKYWKMMKSFYIQYKSYLLPISDEELKTFLSTQITHYMGLTDKLKQDIINNLKSEADVNRLWFEHTTGCVPFRNCIKGKNTTGPFAFAKWHNINYIPDAKLPKLFEDYVRRLVPEVKYRERLYAYLCYLLHENKGIQQILILHGERGIGKSELMNFIAASIVCTSNLDIKQILQDRGSEAALRYVYAALFDEISSLNVDVETRDRIKKWATQHTLNIRSVYETGTMNLPWFGRIIMSTNELPYSQYIDQAYLSRICLIPCVKSFEGKPIADFVEQLLLFRDEIWSWIYDHYHMKMIEILGIRSDLTLEEYNQKVNPFQQFLHTIEADTIYQISLDMLYNHYRTFAGDTAIIKNEFGKKLKDANIDKFKEGKVTYYCCRIIPKKEPDYTDEELEEMEKIAYGLNE